MSEIKTSVTLAPNDGARDNKKIVPAGGDIFIQINRGIDCVITDYRVALGALNPAGEMTLIREIGKGSLPSAQQVGGAPAFFRVDSPAALRDRLILVAVQGIALPPGDVSQIDFIIGVFQQLPVGYRRIEWEVDSAHDTQLKSRFEIAIT